MRHWIIVLLLVLTPWRLWAADSMAVEMATHGVGSPRAAATVSAHAAEHALHCAGMADHALDGHSGGTMADDGMADSGDGASHGGSPCGHCAACQVCTAVALMAPQPVISLGSQVHHLPQVTLPTFSSAELAPGQKPPIF